MSALRTVAGKLPAGPGVYRFRDSRGRVLYIGRASVLRHRVSSYWMDLRGRRHVVRRVPQIVRIEAVACDSVHEAVWLERNLLERTKPRWNRIRGGAEVPVCIRLERRAGAPRLTVRHWPPVDRPGVPASAVETLGRTSAEIGTRLAVSALERVLPLRYTDVRLAGGQRDLARVRGVEAADQDSYLATLTAVLRRRPAEVESVREQLVRQRDRASAHLAFELAARIELEIQAVDWIVAEQKVTQLFPADCEAYGWDNGLLVGFRIRGGRLCGWEQRTCRWPAAQPYLDQTPAGWSTFTAHNAELGRRLADAHLGGS